MNPSTSFVIFYFLLMRTGRVSQLYMRTYIHARTSTKTGKDQIAWSEKLRLFLKKLQEKVRQNREMTRIRAMTANRATTRQNPPPSQPSATTCLELCPARVLPSCSTYSKKRSKRTRMMMVPPFKKPVRLRFNKIRNNVLLVARPQADKTRSIKPEHLCNAIHALNNHCIVSKRYRGASTCRNTNPDTAPPRLP